MASWSRCYRSAPAPEATIILCDIALSVSRCYGRFYNKALPGSPFCILFPSPCLFYFLSGFFGYVTSFFFFLPPDCQSRSRILKIPPVYISRWTLTLLHRIMAAVKIPLKRANLLDVFAAVAFKPWVKCWRNVGERKIILMQHISALHLDKKLIYNRANSTITHKSFLVSFNSIHINAVHLLIGVLISTG